MVPNYTGEYLYLRFFNLEQQVNGCQFQTTQQGEPLLLSIQTNYCSYVFNEGKELIGV